MAKSRKRRRSPFFSKAVMAVYVLAGAGLLLSYLSPFVSPARFWPVAFFGLAYPFFFVLNFFFALLWLLRWRKRFWIPFFLLLLGLPLHKKHFGLRFPDRTPPPDSAIRVMSYNTHSFSRHGKSFSKTIKGEMLGVIRETDPDVIALQEFYTRPEGPFDIKDSLEQILGTSYHFIEIVEKNDFESRGIALFSKFPIENKKAVHFSGNKSYNSCMYMDITVRGKKIRVFNIHLQSISFQPEDYRYLSRVKDDLEADVSSSRRIGGRLKRAFIQRASQAETVAALIRESPYPVILCGDFNDTPLSYAYQTILNEGLQSAFTKKGSGYAITYGGAFPNYQIDHILYREGAFRALNYEIIKKKLSDHYPICSDLVILGENTPASPGPANN